MKMIPTYIHGMIDYIYAIGFMVLPNICDFADLGTPTALSRIIGVVILAQALMTKYELGAFPVISMRTHLAMDYVMGAFFIAAPWLFGFADAGSNVWMPFVILGIAELGATMMTELQPRRIGVHSSPVSSRL